MGHFFFAETLPDPTGGWVAIFQNFGLVGGTLLILLFCIVWAGKKLIDRHVKFLDDFTIGFERLMEDSRKQTRSWRVIEKRMRNMESIIIKTPHVEVKRVSSLSEPPLPKPASDSDKFKPKP